MKKNLLIILVALAFALSLSMSVLALTTTSALTFENPPDTSLVCGDTSPAVTSATDVSGAEEGTQSEPYEIGLKAKIIALSMIGVIVAVSIFVAVKKPKD